MNNQQNLVVGDIVEVINDYRHLLNGMRGKIIEIVDKTARVKFDHVGRGREAVVYLENLKKVEVG